jgi:hypothetical protein
MPNAKRETQSNETQSKLKARSSPGVPFYNKIDSSFLRRIAVALTTGSKEKDPHLLIENWRLGDLEFFHERANHEVEHIQKWFAGDRTEDHLAHAACNIMMLMFAEERGIYNPLPVDQKMQAWVDYVTLNEQNEPDSKVENNTVESEVNENQNSEVNGAGTDDPVFGISVENLLEETEYKDKVVGGNGKLTVSIDRIKELLLK